ncbi:hypothetical protein [uncultured Mediterranean phage uvDeep-CGR2-KM21-C345]|nr:hypothetical protein [uncultured Mediterranean phage uvDeep-CGR2-KM21-C345]
MKTKKRYIVELTEAQMNMVFTSLEVYEMDTTGGGCFKDIGKLQEANLMERIKKALHKGQDNGLKTLKL